MRASPFVPALALAQPDRGRVDRLRQCDLALVAALTDVSLVNPSPGLVGAGVRYGATDQTVGSTVGRFSPSGEGSQDVDGYRVNAAVWTETHLGPRGRRVSPFVGVQIDGGRSAMSFVSPEACPGCGAREAESSSAWVSLGVVGGAELMVLRGPTLSAAMWLGGGYSATKTREAFSDGPTREYDASGLTFGTGGTALRLSIFL